MAKVKVYSTSACPYCVMLENWLNENMVEHDHYNVGEDREKAKEMIIKTGQRGVPVIDIDGEVIVGFAKARIEAVLKEKGLLS